MIVTCPRCFATYNVPAAAVAGTGRMVRCSSCRFEWSETAPPDGAIAALAPEFPEPAVTRTAPLPKAPTPTSLPDSFEAAFSDAQQTHQAATVPEPVAPPPAPRAAASRASSRSSSYAKPPQASLLKRLGTKAAWGVLGLVTVACLLILLREPLGKRSLTLTDFYEDIGLPIESPEDWFRFEAVKLEKNEISGLTVFNIHGRIFNQSRRERDVPNIKLFWRSARGDIGPMVVLSPDTTPLPLGVATAFSGELKGVDASRGGEVKLTFVTELEAAVLKPGAVNHAAPQPAAQPAHAAPAAPAPHSEAAPESAHEQPALVAPAPEQPAAPAAEHPAPDSPIHSAPLHTAPETSHEATQPAPAH